MAERGRRRHVEWSAGRREGRIPYRDFYDLRPPGSFYWLGSFFTFFGATWRVARMHLLLTGTGMSLLVFHLARRALGRLEAFLLCALVTTVSIPMWPRSRRHSDSNLFALMAATAFFYWHDRGGSRWLFASGILAGLTSCFIYQKGFLLLASFLAVAAIARLCFRVPVKWVTSACTMLAGYGAVGLAVLAWLSYLGALQDVVNFTIRLPANTYVGGQSSSVRVSLDAACPGRPAMVAHVPAGRGGLRRAPSDDASSSDIGVAVWSWLLPLSVC